MFPHMAGDQSGIGVVTAAGRKANDETDGLAFKKVGLSERMLRSATEKETKKNRYDFLFHNYSFRD